LKKRKGDLGKDGETRKDKRKCKERLWSNERGSASSKKKETKESCSSKEGAMKKGKKREVHHKEDSSKPKT